MNSNYPQKWIEFWVYMQIFCGESTSNSMFRIDISRNGSKQLPEQLRKQQSELKSKRNLQASLL